MYVSGRGTNGFGTILPAVLEYIRDGGTVTEVFVVGTSSKHSLEAKMKAEEIMHRTGVSVKLATYPAIGENVSEAYQTVLNKISGPACAIVSVPDHLHHRITKDCLERGLHTLVVKPLTPTVTESFELIALAAKNNLYGAVEFHKRWDRHNRILRDEYQCGKFGIPLYTWAEYSQRKSIPSLIFRKWAEQSSIIQYLGVHYVDIIRFVTGAVPIRAMATGQKAWLRQAGLNLNDAIQCHVEWKTDEGIIFVQTLLVNWIDPEQSSAMSDQKLKFVGTQGRYDSDQKERGVRLLYDGQQLDEPNPDFCRSYHRDDQTLEWKGYGIDSIKTFLSDVRDIFEDRIQPLELEGNRPTFSESLYSTAVIEAAHDSLLNLSKWEKVKLSL